MLNNKAFTVVELLASFTLTMIIVTFLFEIVLELKDVYINQSLKTRIINKNAIVATTLNKHFSDKEITAASCSNSTCTVTYKDSSSEVIKVASTGITIGSKTIQMPSDYKSTVVNNINLKASALVDGQINNGKDNYYIKINYEVTSPYLTKAIPFTYIYTY